MPDAFNVPEADVESSQKAESPTTSLSVKGDSPPLSPETPDGGLQAWLSVLGGFLVCVATFGYSNSFGVYQDYYVLKGASSSSNVSWIGSLQLFFMFAVGLPAGKIFDQGYFHQILGFGSVLYVFSLFMLSLANPTKYYQLVLAQGIGMGIGSGLMFVPTISVQAHHWRVHRSLAMGIVMTGTGIGGLIFPIMLNRLINDHTGFAWGVRATAFLDLGLLAIANSVMTTRSPSAKQRGPGPKLDMKAILTDWPYLVFLLGCVAFSYAKIYFYLQLWMNVHGLSGTLGFYTIAILNGSSIFGRTLLNMLADKIGPLNVFWPVAIMTAALMFVMFSVTSTGAAIVFSMFYGFFSGGLISMFPPTAARFAEDLHEIGLRIGIAFFIGSFGLLTGTPIAGALYDSGGQWYRPIVFSAVVMVAGASV
ncbi:major facilitator superfamily domain-containing protein [Fomitopsis betulina]|nr:major facilitator superfamily domain-containing protein [Fomitopsis betulina]